MRKQEERRKQFIQIAVMLIGTFLMAFGYYHFNFQNNLSEGGFIGLALLGEYAFGFSPAIIMIILDIPILIIAAFVKGKKFIYNTVIAATSLSVFYELFDRFSPLVMDFKDNMLIVAVLSGLVTGLGAGLVLRFGGATGGDDIMALLLSKTMGIKVGTMFVIFDMIVLLLSLKYLTLTQTLYTILAVNIAGKVITWTVEFGLTKPILPSPMDATVKIR